jgi:hypothetical protein
MPLDGRVMSQAAVLLIGAVHDPPENGDRMAKVSIHGMPRAHSEQRFRHNEDAAYAISVLDSNFAHCVAIAQH